MILKKIMDLDFSIYNIGKPDPTSSQIVVKYSNGKNWFEYSHDSVGRAYNQYHFIIDHIQPKIVEIWLDGVLIKREGQWVPLNNSRRKKWKT